MTTPPSNTGPIDFIIENFNTDIQLDLSGQLQRAFAGIDASSTAVLYVDASLVRDTFKIQIDSSDVIDASSSDIKYFIDRNAFWGNDVSHSFSINAGDAVISGSDGIIPVASFNKNMVCHDFTRYLSLKLFSTPYAVDLFNNELELLTNIRAKSQKVWGTIDNELLKYDIRSIPYTPSYEVIDLSLAGVRVSYTPQETIGYGGLWNESGTDYKYFTNDASGNITKKLLEQIAQYDPERFATMLQNTTNMQSLPFLSGDSISLKLTIRPEPTQHILTDVEPIGPRTYRIKYTMLDNYKPLHSGEIQRDTAENENHRLFDYIPIPP